MDKRPKKGQKTPGSGRQKGTPNKKTLEFQEVLRKHNFDPAEEMIWCYREFKKISQHRKKRGNLIGSMSALSAAEKTANDISQYVYPKKKAIEHSGEVGVKTFADFIAAGESDESEEND